MCNYANLCNKKASKIFSTKADHTMLVKWAPNRCIVTHACGQMDIEKHRKAFCDNVFL